MKCTQRYALYQDETVHSNYDVLYSSAIQKSLLHLQICVVKLSLTAMMSHSLV